MVRVVYKRVPQSSLADLSDIDLRVLDMALAEYLDRLVQDEADPLYVLTARHLHECVLRIKAGEEIEVAD